MPVADRAHRGLHLLRRGAALPVVDVVEDHFEAAGGQGLAHGVGVVAVRHDVLDPPAEVVLGLAVQDRDFVAALHQLLHQLAADEQGPPDDQYFHKLPRE